MDSYILTLKLYCGHCKDLMTGWSGTGKLGKLHRYYMCNGKKKKICNKKNVRKDNIEDTVVRQCRAILTNENIDKIADEVVAFNESEQQSNENLKRLEKLVSDNKKQHDNLMSSLKLCEDDDTKRILLSEISKMAKEAKELRIQLAIEESRKVKITRHDIKFFLMDIRNGDIEDVKYRKILVGALVNKIYLYDDGQLTIAFNNGDTTTEIDANLIDKVEQDIESMSKENEGYFIDNLRPVERSRTNHLHY